MTSETLEVSSPLMDLGPVVEFDSPDACVEWLRANILTGETFSLSQMELAKEWARLVGEDEKSGIGERDALIIVDFVKITRTLPMRQLVMTRAERLVTVLETPNTYADTWQSRVMRWSQTCRSHPWLGDDMTRVISRFVYLSRRWPR